MSGRPSSHPVYLRWWVWATYIVLFAIAIPWYWPEREWPVVLGMPVWAAVSVGTSLVISIFTAWLLLFHWPEPDATSDEDAP